MNCTEITPTCPVEESIYGFYPSLAANGFFCGWFALLFFPNVFLSIYYKAWMYGIALSIGCAIEAIGYGGRFILHSNPFSEAGFDMQICCIILGPAFNSAAIYVTLKHIVTIFGPEYSIVRPTLYTWIFITGDLISLVLQAVGGGMAASAGDNIQEMNQGNDIMIAGICWQVFTLFAFGIAVVRYILKRRKAILAGQQLNHEASATLMNPRFRLFAVAISTAYLAIFFRCVYRIVEMAGGWGNTVMRDETSFIILEGVMIAYASCVQTVFHPGYCFPQMTGRGQSQSLQEKTELPSDRLSE